METDTVLLWLNAVFQCVLSVCVISVSVRLCIPRGGGSRGPRGGRVSWRSRRSVACCLRQCLGWVSTVGNTVAVPIMVLLTLRTPQCLYTCITLVCCPLLVRQFKMFLMLLLTLNAHLQHRLGDRYAALVTRPRVLCLVLLSWLVSVVSSFAQFIVWNAQDRWGTDPLELGLGRPQGGNWSTPFPSVPPKLPYPQDRSVIGTYLPYGGFLSKFLITYTHNFTYAEIHGSHWGVCAADTVLRPDFMLYVYGVTVFLVPLLVMLAVYLDLMCVAPRLDTGTEEASGKSVTAHSRSVALSLSLLVLLSLPLHVTHAVKHFAPGRSQPPWAMLLVSLLFQSYGLVPPLLFREKKVDEGGVGSSGAPAEGVMGPSPRRKTMGRAFWVTLQDCLSWCPRSPTGTKAKVCPEV